MTLRRRIEKLRAQLRHRKHLREVHRHAKQGHKAKREGRAIRRLRRLVDRLLAPRIQFDAVTLVAVPKDALAVACYKNGRFANEAEAHRRFPNAKITTISVRASDLADCLDVENGNATPAECPDYYRRFKARWPHRKPIFYTFAGQGAELIAALARIGAQPDKDFIYWSAHWDGEHICGPKTCGFPKAAATQWTTHNETYDQTKCRPSYWERG